MRITNHLVPTLSPLFIFPSTSPYPLPYQRLTTSRISHLPNQIRRNTNIPLPYSYNITLTITLFVSLEPHDSSGT